MNTERLAFPDPPLARPLFRSAVCEKAYIVTGEELQSRATSVFSIIKAGQLKLRMEHNYRLSEAQQAHHDLEGGKTTGNILPIS